MHATARRVEASAACQQTGTPGAPGRGPFEARVAEPQVATNRPTRHLSARHPLPQPPPFPLRTARGASAPSTCASGASSRPRTLTKGAEAGVAPTAAERSRATIRFAQRATRISRAKCRLQWIRFAQHAARLLDNPAARWPKRRAGPRHAQRSCACN